MTSIIRHDAKNTRAEPEGNWRRGFRLGLFHNAFFLFNRIGFRSDESETLGSGRLKARFEFGVLRGGDRNILRCVRRGGGDPRDARLCNFCDASICVRERRRRRAGWQRPRPHHCLLKGESGRGGRRRSQRGRYSHQGRGIPRCFYRWSGHVGRLFMDAADRARLDQNENEETIAHRSYGRPSGDKSFNNRTNDPFFFRSVCWVYLLVSSRLRR